MSKGTTSIRLTTETVERMRAEIVKILDAVEGRKLADPGVVAESINPKALGLTYDQLINYLLDRREVQHKRNRRHGAKKRGEGAVELADQ